LNFNSPRGTSDIFGPDIYYREYIIGLARDLFRSFSYEEIITPTFEHTEVFTRGIGQYSDIVSKEMYTFADKKGRSITLRPEGTAPVVRAFIENKLYSRQLPLKLFYIGNMFRYERPQKGRMREFSQLGIEAMGSEDPSVDAESIWLINQFFLQAGFKNLKLLLNSIGCMECRKEFIKILEEYLEDFKDGLCADCKGRYQKNTLRVYDCKVSSCKDILKEAPKIDQFICGGCSAHFKRILDILDVIGIRYETRQSLVRGFDYYTRTIFEIVSEDIESAQNALGGGGRYDNLIKEFGGPQLSSVGFAVGIERTCMLMEELGIEPGKENGPKKIYFIRMNEKNDPYVFKVLKYFRQKQYSCNMNFNIRNMSTELKYVRDAGYDFAVIIGEEEAEKERLTLKEISTFKQSNFDFNNEKNKIIDFIEQK
jgi:histidyl-tRNA synthetase